METAKLTESQALDQATMAVIRRAKKPLTLTETKERVSEEIQNSELAGSFSSDLREFVKNHASQSVVKLVDIGKLRVEAIDGDRKIILHK